MKKKPIHEFMRLVCIVQDSCTEQHTVGCSAGTKSKLNSKVFQKNLQCGLFSLVKVKTEHDW